MSCHPFVFGVKAQLIERLLKRTVLIGNGEGQRNTKSVQAHIQIAGQEVAVRISSAFDTFGRIEYLI